MTGHVVHVCESNLTTHIKVSQKLSEQDVIERAESLSFPQSVLEVCSVLSSLSSELQLNCHPSVLQYYQGYLGIPPGGFPEPLRTRILEAKRLPKIEGRPGASLPPLDFGELKQDLEERWGEGAIRDEDVISAALYPKVIIFSGRRCVASY